MQWNPSQYGRFAEPRLRPAADLLARVNHPGPQAIYDLGCGSGASTQLIAQRWPKACVTGVDSSPAMLARAREALPHASWVAHSIETFRPDLPADLLYSNAALHWVDDHSELFPRLVGLLSPGGTLAVQMPRNFSEPSHRALAETVRAGSWRESLTPLLRSAPVLSPDAYHRLLAVRGAELDIWETEYLHLLRGPDPVLEWMKGTALAPLLAALPPDEATAFESEYADRLRRAYPQNTDGSTFFPFRRLFIVLQT